MGKIAVIIPVHNRLEYTKKCLRWLYESIAKANEPIAIKVVLVDDGSADNTFNWVRQHYPEIIILNGDGNLWWSGAVNRGAKYALDALKCEYVLLWNNDVRPDIDYFYNLQSIIKENIDRNIIIGSKVYFLDKPNVICFMGGIFNARTGERRLIGSNQTDSNKYKKIISVDWCGGMGTLIHKSVFDKIGFWDEETFPQYHGDSDFTLRAKKQGIKSFIYPALRIYNNTSSSGLLHNSSFQLLARSFFSLRSHYNVSKNVKFYRRYAESQHVYVGLIKWYLCYIGGFLKWKFLSFWR